MIDAAVIAEAKQNRSFSYRPADPLGVSSSALERARKRLTAFDWRLALWWGANRHAWNPDGSLAEVPGRWCVMEWMPRHGHWHRCFYLEGPNGEYRDFEPVQAIIDRLGRASMLTTQEAAEKAERDTHKAKMQRANELIEANREFHEDFAARHHGIRQTFGPGYIRRRQVSRGDLQNTNHQRFVKAHQKKWDGSPR